MIDSELLVAAADAAGIRHTGEVFALGLKLMDGPHNYWNPLGDDGVAFRLAVKLGLAVSVEYQVGSTNVLWGPPMGCVREDHGTDPNAATRRAIVRAAAAMAERAAQTGGAAPSNNNTKGPTP